MKASQRGHLLGLLCLLPGREGALFNNLLRTFTIFVFAEDDNRRNKPSSPLSALEHNTKDLSFFALRSCSSLFAATLQLEGGSAPSLMLTRALSQNKPPGQSQDPYISMVFELCDGGSMCHLWRRSQLLSWQRLSRSRQGCHLRRHAAISRSNAQILAGMWVRSLQQALFNPQQKLSTTMKISFALQVIARIFVVLFISSPVSRSLTRLLPASGVPLYLPLFGSLCPVSVSVVLVVYQRERARESESA
eukprot:3213457-Rhodomonas_salina.1